MSISRTMAVALLAAMITGLTGCSTTNSTPRSAMSKAEFIRQADSICKTANEKFNRLFDTDFPSHAERLPAFFTKAAPIMKERADKLAGLQTVKEDEATIKKLVGAARKTAGAFANAQSDQEAGQKLFTEDGGKQEQTFRETAKSYGLKECASDAGNDDQQTVKKMDPSKLSAEKRAFVDKGDAICKEAQEKFKPVEQEVFSSFPPTLENWAKGIPKMVAIFRPETDELAALPAPAQDQAAYKKIIDTRNGLLNSLEEAQKAAAARDENKFQQIAAPVFPKFDEIDAMERQFGFQVCGSEDEGE